jgi:peptidoglycan/LPS O-acetylase OafA/YrhL
MLQHTWSLSVEEQFYIFWPSILVILLKSDRTSATKLAVALILLAPVLRVVTHLSGNEFLAHKIYYMLHTRMDSLMFGCLAALLEGGAVAVVAYYRLRPIATLFPVFVFVISPQLEHRLGGAYTYTMGYTLVSFSVVMMMLYAVRESEAPVGKLLNSRFVVHIGVISYSIYLWQQIFLHWATTSIFGKFPLNIVCIIATAEFSHTFVEQPFMRWRRRFEKQQLEARAMAVSA